MKTSLFALALGLWAVAPDLTQDLPAAAAQAETPLHKRVTVDYREIPVAAALKDLGTKAGIPFECPEKLLQGLDLVTCAGTEQEAGLVAMRILRPRGLKL